ncbi:hypothetical protein PUN28_009717 [Cardiocondyla obscurior]|uniref:SWIM-type domain-containing protein n=1 Tax=Cardiocondyla obscurior TaxID=286306 RepID=A0AAW2FTN0_9HYME
MYALWDQNVIKVSRKPDKSDRDAVNRSRNCSCETVPSYLCAHISQFIHIRGRCLRNARLISKANSIGSTIRTASDSAVATVLQEDHPKHLASTTFRHVVSCKGYLKRASPGDLAPGRRDPRCIPPERAIARSFVLSFFPFRPNFYR